MTTYKNLIAATTVARRAATEVYREESFSPLWNKVTRIAQYLEAQAKEALEAL